MGKAYEYGVLLKPKVLVAMLALYVASYFSSYAASGGGPLHLDLFVLGFLAVAIAVSGANALNCYMDRDIDALMTRTWGRPLALGTIQPLDALAFSGALLVAASVISFYLGAVPFLLFLEGSGSYLFLYTSLAKRKTSINVLATAPSVATPAWFGWYIGGAPLYPVGILMGLLVAVWGPLHLWSLAYAYSKDYSKAGIPMLPTVIKGKGAILGILGVLATLIASSYMLIPWINSEIYLLGISFINIPLALAGLRFYITGRNRHGWLLFKLTAPYIVLVLLLFMVDQLFFA
ncbi:MAG: protoheme IX farnesyltransferase [Candidatus Bathyarchaeota archaeon]|jgi:protoheme IX farnesyltransferase